MCRDGNFRPHYTQTEDYSFAVTAAFDTPVKTKGNLSQTPLLALTDVETHEFGTLIFGWMLTVSTSGPEMTAPGSHLDEAHVMQSISVPDPVLQSHLLLLSQKQRQSLPFPRLILHLSFWSRPSSCHLLSFLKLKPVLSPTMCRYVQISSLPKQDNENLPIFSWINELLMCNKVPPKNGLKQ